MSFPTVTRGDLSIDVLIWIEAKNRTNGATETAGFWTGIDDRSFTIGGVARSYAGAGPVLEMPQIVSQSGVNVQLQEASLNVLTPEVEQVLRGYDARNAPIEVHLARFNPDTNALVDTTRVFKGWIDSMREVRGPKDGTTALAVQMASSSRALTRKLHLLRSDEAQKARTSDRIYRYADVSGSVPVYWGQKKKR